MRFALVFVAACGTSMSPDPGGMPPGDDDPVPTPDATTTVASCTGKTSQPLDATWSIGSRTANVHVPASYDPTKPTPVVIDIHGRTANADSQMLLSRSKAKSDAAGFIVVHPQSATSPTSWNAGTCCSPANSGTDDVGFIAALLDELEAKLCVDPARVFAMGMSNGAYLSHSLACKLSDRIAAVGPVAGLLLESTCTPTRPVPVMMVNGTSDTLSQYQYVDEGVNFWVGKNDCTTTETTFTQGDASCVTHGGCTGGADVVLCTIADGGHQWPGGGTTLPLLGKKSDNLSSTDAIWDFFQTHPRP